MWLLIFLFLIRLFNSSFILIPHVLSPSIVHLNILLSVFLSVINNFRFIDYRSTHVLLAYCSNSFPLSKLLELKKRTEARNKEAVTSA